MTRRDSWSGWCHVIPAVDFCDPVEQRIAGGEPDIRVGHDDHPVAGIREHQQRRLISHVAADVTETSFRRAEEEAQRHLVRVLLRPQYVDHTFLPLRSQQVTRRVLSE